MASQPRVIRPDSVIYALWVLIGLVLGSGLAAVMSFVMADSLVLAWARGNPEAASIVGREGLAGLKASSIDIPAFSQLAVVMFVVFAALAWVLGAFLGSGHGWARLSLIGVAIMAIFSLIVVLREDLPTPFVVVAIAEMGGLIALVALLCRRDTTAFVRGS